MIANNAVYGRRGVWLVRLILVVAAVSLCLFVAGWAWSQSAMEGVPTGAEGLIQIGMLFSLVVAIAAAMLVFSTGDPLVTVRGSELSAYVNASCPDSMLQLDAAGQLVNMNAAAESRFGYSVQSVRGAHLRHLPALLLGKEVVASTPEPAALLRRPAPVSIAARELAFRAGIRLAHLSTPLLGYSEMAIAQLGGDHPCRADLEEIGRSSVQVALLAKMLEVYGGVRRTQWAAVDLPRFLREMAPDLKLLLKPSTRVVLEAGRGNAGNPVSMDPELARLVVMLLARNAEAAMPEGGELRLRAEGGVLVVRDSGVGLPGRGAPGALFEPVFDVRKDAADPEQGVGLGLHVAHTAAALQGAELKLHATGATGTEFYVAFSEAGAGQDGQRIPSSDTGVGGPQLAGPGRRGSS